MDKQRTLAQNSALHLLFQMISDDLNNHGLYVSNVIKADAPWNKDRVKELIWKSTQEKMTNKKSTTSLTSNEIDDIFMVIQKALTDLGLEIQFPSINSIIKRLQDGEETTNKERGQI